MRPAWCWTGATEFLLTLCLHTLWHNEAPDRKSKLTETGWSLYVITDKKKQPTVEKHRMNKCCCTACGSFCTRFKSDFKDELWQHLCKLNTATTLHTYLQHFLQQWGAIFVSVCVTPYPDLHSVVKMQFILIQSKTMRIHSNNLSIHYLE